MKCLQVLVLGVTLIAVANAAVTKCVLFPTTGGTGSVPLVDTDICAQGETDCVTVYKFSDTANTAPDAPEVVKRSCLNNAKTECKDNTNYCAKCTGDGCNKDVELKTVSSCITCASSDTCTKNPAEAPSSKTGYLCSTEVIVQGETTKNVRKSITTATELKACQEKGTSCTLCQGLNCNIDTLPTDRKVCGTNKCLKANDDCKAMYNTEGAHKGEGCAAEMNSQCEQADIHCIKCATAADCPTALTKKCYKCTNCNNKNAAEVVTCDDDCVTKVEDGKVNRGCKTKEFDCKNDMTCKTCKKPFCNSLVVAEPSLKCYQCDKSKAGCGGELKSSEVPAETCKLKTIDAEQCYSKKGKIERGCLSSLTTAEDEELYKNCKEGKDCRLCPTDSCNDDHINASATATAAMLLVAIAAFVASINN